MTNNHTYKTFDPNLISAKTAIAIQAIIDSGKKPNINTLTKLAVMVKKDCGMDNNIFADVLLIQSIDNVIANEQKQQGVKTP